MGSIRKINIQRRPYSERADTDQGRGIGKLLIHDVLAFIKENSFHNVKVACNLYANKGKEEFYKKFGFQELPNDNYGYGMILEVDK